MLVSVVAPIAVSATLLIGATSWWAARLLTSPARFATTVAPLPRHRLVRRAVRRHAPAGLGPLAERLAATAWATRIWTRVATIAHRRARRWTHRLALLATAGVATLITPTGRWRVAAWLAGTAVLATTLHAMTVA